jgi:undecaprenyl-diphosphatase
MSDWMKAVVLGLVQGLTEFFPVSSSAHLIAFRKVLDFKVEGLAFDLSVHLATLFATLIYFRREILGILASEDRWGILLRIGLATAPIIAVGFLLKSFRDNPPVWTPVAGWIFSGAYLLLARGLTGSLGYRKAPLLVAIGVGAAQSLAVFPGVSRSGSTITSGVWLGLSREEAARFSFLLSIVAVLLACGDKGRALITSNEPHGNLWAAAGVAMPVAFVSGLFAIHWILRMVRSNIFHRFGWYNLAAAITFGAYLLWHRA